MQNQKARYHMLDLLRGLAVFLMILAHSVYFFHNRDNSFILALETIGNTFCYVAFLLVSGAVSYIAYIHNNDNAIDKKRIFKRILVLLLSYYLIAIFVEIKNVISADGFAKLKIIFDIISFRLLPSYTEYIVPFIIYPVLLIFFNKFFSYLSKKVTVVLIFSVLVYLSGYILYQIPVEGYLLPWKALLAGADGYFRFPILQYFSIYAFGLCWGYRLITLKNVSKKRKFVGQCIIIFAILSLIIIYGGNNLAIPLGDILLRWPPAPGFLFLSLALSFLAAYIIYLFKRFSALPVMRDFLLVLGQNAFAIFWAHIFLLSLYEMAHGPQVSSLGMFILMFLFLVIASLILATVLPFNYRFVLCHIKKSSEDQEEALQRSSIIKLEEEIVAGSKKEYRLLHKYFFPHPDGTARRRKLIKKRHLIAGIVIGAVAAILVSPLVVQEIKTSIKRNANIHWWDDSYAFRKNLKIHNLSSFSNISENQALSFEFDHQKLVEMGEARLDGGDIKILYYNGKNYQALPFLVENSWSLPATRITFLSQSLINGGDINDSYFIYYGNTLATNDKASFDVKPTSAEYSIELGDTKTHAVTAEVSKKWNLIEDQDSDRIIEIYGKPNIELDNAKATYQIIGTQIKREMALSSDGLYCAELSISDLSAGTYQVQIEINDEGNVYLSQKEGFFVSYPLYIAWTYDWEGYDVSGAYLNATEDISNEYNLPITHFFNPRIYITNTINQERVEYLTAWLKKRLSVGDGFALHLHMFYDFVTAAGIEAKKEPRWDKAEGDGYSVLTSAYTQDEMKQIIFKALQELERQGLPRPQVYRAGGWFANLDTLKALDELGFGADSSGRTKYSFGQNNQSGHWNLESTTQPYFPSQTDQNTSSLSNHLKLLEIPNNGADSYWFSASQMIERFNANFNRMPLKDKKQLTFLSHPHWFKPDEQERVRQLFKYLSQYNNSSDSGPVIYATSQQILELWTK